MNQRVDEGRLFEAILESPDSFIGVLDPDGTLRRSNRTAIAFVDASREAVEGRPFWETPWWNHSDDLQERLRSWVARAAEGEHVRYEASHYAPDGTEAIVDGVLRPITDGDGEVVSIIAEGRDITERRQYERRVADQRAELNRLNRISETLRAVHQEIVRAEDRAQLERAVCTCLTYTDVYEGAWIGRYDERTEVIEPTTWSDIDDAHMETLALSADDTHPGFGPAGRAVRSRRIQVIEDVATAEAMAPWRDSLSSLGVESVAAIPVVHDDHVYGIVGIWANRPTVFEDEERAALSELGQSIGNAFAALETRATLERQNERLEQFASVVSHDLRNPLSVARGRMELLGEESDSEHVGEAINALDRMDTLVSDLLALARSGEDIQDLESVELAGLVESCWETVATDEASIAVETNGSVYADRSRLRQLVENLIGNAVEHGGSDVTVRVGVLEDRDGFYVADDGPGIPPERRERVFESGYTTGEGGVGLGLAIVQEIAKAHGWTITVAESESGGTRFEITGVDTAEG